MILKGPDDSSMCLGNPPSYSAFVLGPAFYLVFSRGETWTDGLRDMVVEKRTDGGQGDEERCVRIHVSAHRAMGGTHTLTRVLTSVGYYD